MPRRKQSCPLANTGRVEDRQEFKNKDDGLLDDSGLQENDNDLEEWEIKNSFSGRPKKRLKKISSEIETECNILSQPTKFPFAVIGVTLVQGRLDELGKVRLSPVDDGICVQDGQTQAECLITTPSSKIAQDLCILCKSECISLSRYCGEDDREAQAVTLGEEGRRGDTNIPYDSGKQNPKTSFVLCLGPKILKEVVDHPEDERHRLHWICMLHILRWLRPETRLDPDSEIPVDCPDEIVNSPLCSPRKNLSIGCSTKAHLLENQDARSKEVFDPAELYKAVKPSGGEPEWSADLPQLKPSLRGYQRRALHWMLGREGVFEVNQLEKAEVVFKSSLSLHPLWREVPCLDLSNSIQCSNISSSSESFFINPWSGAISFRRFPAPLMPSGGIACDEMGLGKTVEMLALIVSNRYLGDPPAFDIRAFQKLEEHVDCVCGSKYLSGSKDTWIQCHTCLGWQHIACVGVSRRTKKTGFQCQTCQQREASISITEPCGTTLIVCPNSILWQWNDEIHQHIVSDTLKVFVYEGQPQWAMERQHPSKVINAMDLAKADIVLTTYDVLRKDLDHSHTESGMNLRQKKRYKIIPTPLNRLKFWRIIVDEAQMVESSTAAATEMVRKLKCVHRWCVTGTPISRGLEDLQGLLAFLQLSPYENRTWWGRCIQKPYNCGIPAARARLLQILKPNLGGIMWRSSKADVQDELGLPEQHHHLKMLTLSAIERHFYNRQHQDCIGKARNAISSSSLDAAEAAAETSILLPSKSDEKRQNNNTGSEKQNEFEDRLLTRSEERKLLYPLLRLRQACVHPQIGSSGIRSLTASRSPMTMQEVLGVLITKSKVEAEEAQRQLIFSLNGLAGLFLLQDKKKEAAHAYREALRFIDDCKGRQVDTDPLFQIHTIYNLLDLIQSSSGAVPRTLRDDDYVQRMNMLRDRYSSEAICRLEDAEKKFKNTKKSIQNIKEDLVKWSKNHTEEIMEMWFIEAISILTRYSHDRGYASVCHIREKLSEENTYRSITQRNALSLSSKRFETLTGLMSLLVEEMKMLKSAYEEVFQGLEKLSELCAMNPPPQELIESAGSCARCRSETAIKGRVCQHCKLDEKFIRLQVRLFAIIAPSLKAGQQLTAEQVAEQLIRQSYARIGRGGLKEEGDPDGNSETLEARQGSHASRVQQQDLKPSQLETVLRILYHDFKLLVLPDDPKLKSQKDMLIDFGKAHLKIFEMWRDQFVKARAVASEQRQKLYMYDELSMCVSRIEIKKDEEIVPPGMELLKISEAEIPIRSVELTADKSVAEDVLQRKLGTLRYLESLQSGQNENAVFLNHKNDHSNTTNVVLSSSHGVDTIRISQQEKGFDNKVDRSATEDEPCPICQEPLIGFTEICMFVCGHRVCFSCQELLIERLPIPLRQKGHISCPTCRIRVSVKDICIIANQPKSLTRIELGASDMQCTSYMSLEDDNIGVSGKEEMQLTPWQQIEEEISITGSYGTKLEAVLRRIKSILYDEESKIIVFSSWKESLELLSHAMDANNIPHLYPKSRKVFNQAIMLFKDHNELTKEKDLGASCKGDSLKYSKMGPSSSKGSPPSKVRVLLLLLKQGGNGLNLQNAQHVILIEPMLDPAEEAQAIGRVDRIGQRHDTHVHRFIIKDSIEENVYCLGKYRAAEMDLAAAAVRRGKASREKGGLSIRDVAALLHCNYQSYVEVQKAGAAQL